MSNYWIGWLAFKSSGAILDLLQLSMFFSSWLRSKLFGRTPRTIRNWTKPKEFDYAINIANMMLVLLVAIVCTSSPPLFSRSRTDERGGRCSPGSVRAPVRHGRILHRELGVQVPGALVRPSRGMTRADASKAALRLRH